MLPFVERLGTPADHKRHLAYESQHDIPRAEQIRETLNWLDSTSARLDRYRY